MIVILDYDMGNVGSIQNMLKKIRAENVVISRDPEIISKADGLILPGVGSFDMGMENIENFNLKSQIYEHAIIKKKPILGICLGMQILGKSSEEGNRKGLGLLDFDCLKFPQDNSIKIPNMGWNYVEIKDYDDPIVKDLDVNQRYYFVHSYYVKCNDISNVLMTCKYGIEFSAAVRKGKIYGVQFHPEKSHGYGLKLLKNFVEVVRNDI